MVHTHTSRCFACTDASLARVAGSSTLSLLVCFSSLALRMPALTMTFCRYPTASGCPCLPACLPACLSLCLSVSLSVCLSVSLSLSLTHSLTAPPARGPCHARPAGLRPSPAQPRSPNQRQLFGCAPKGAECKPSLSSAAARHRRRASRCRTTGILSLSLSLSLSSLSLSRLSLSHTHTRTRAHARSLMAAPLAR